MGQDPDSDARVGAGKGAMTRWETQRRWWWTGASWGIGRAAAHNTVLTVALRKNVKWSNGSPFTAQDVVFTFDLLKKHPAIDTNGVWSKLASVKAAGSDTVVFQFKHGSLRMVRLGGKTPIVPGAIWSTIGNPLKVLKPKPRDFGARPYQLQTFNSQEYTLVPNARYWGGIRRCLSLSCRCLPVVRPANPRSPRERSVGAPGTCPTLENSMSTRRPSTIAIGFLPSIRCFSIST